MKNLQRRSDSLVSFSIDLIQAICIKGEKFTNALWRRILANSLCMKTLRMIFEENLDGFFRLS